MRLIKLLFQLFQLLGAECCTISPKFWLITITTGTVFSFNIYHGELIEKKLVLKTQKLKRFLPIIRGSGEPPVSCDPEPGLPIATGTVCCIIEAGCGHICGPAGHGNELYGTCGYRPYPAALANSAAARSAARLRRILLIDDTEGAVAFVQTPRIKEAQA